LTLLLPLAIIPLRTGMDADTSPTPAVFHVEQNMNPNDVPLAAQTTRYEIWQRREGLNWNWKTTVGITELHAKLEQLRHAQVKTVLIRQTRTLLYPVRHHEKGGYYAPIDEAQSPQNTVPTAETATDFLPGMHLPLDAPPPGGSLVPPLPPIPENG